MGYLKEKYTEEYFTGQDKDGNNLRYGATKLLDDEGNYSLRNHDRQILERVNFKERNVLSLGCGRGEEIAYAIENGAKAQESVGVDFSSVAIKICKKMFDDKKIDQPKLIVDDALNFVSNYKKEVKKDKSKKFDLVIMFDFVEHVPRKELSKILIDLKMIIKESALIVVNTPAYKYDNDIIEDGFDDRILNGLLDLTDVIPETQGMHCNKYSRLSLQTYMHEMGYVNITEAHYFLIASWAPDNFNNTSYLSRWNTSILRGAPLAGAYRDDEIEYPYSDAPDVKLQKFVNGNLSGIHLMMTDQYKEAAFNNGNIEPEMMLSIQKAKPLGKTIFDIGTRTDASLMLFSKMVGKEGCVVGFEPNPVNRNRTFVNLSHNPKYNENILVFSYALGNDNKKKNMLLSMSADVGYSSASGLKSSHQIIYDSDLPGEFEDLEIEVKKADRFIKESQLVPSIIKLDVEGAEYDFLLGAVETIRKCRPIFFIELHTEYCALKCTEILIAEGYQIEVLREDNNRLMIKAEYIRSSKNKPSRSYDIGVQKELNSARGTIRELTSNIKQLNREFSQERLQLFEERDNLIKQIDEATKNLNDVFVSKSWKATMPLRRLTSILKGIINK